MIPLSSQLGTRLTEICDSLEKEVVGRVIKVYRFEPHSSRKVLIIVGEVTITIVEPLSGTTKKQYTEEFKKFILMIGLNKSSKTSHISRKIMEGCSYIDASMKNKLEGAIEEIKQRDYDNNGIVIHTQMAADGSFLPRYPEIFDEYDLAESQSAAGIHCDENEPDFGKLDHYIELLYEEIPQKIEASFYISKLTTSNSYLHDIAKHESAVNALFRTLREDCKKSTQLTKNILSICLDFAKIKEFQKILIKNKIPQLTLDIVDFELERCEKWKAQLNCLEEAATKSQSTSGRALNDYHMMWIKLDEMTTAQNSLLKVAFEMLHCVSENKVVRGELYQQKIITSLVDAMERKNNEVLEIIVDFLRDISSFRQCIEQLVICEIVDKIAKLLNGGPVKKKVVDGIFHLLYNLSFHPVLRENVLKCGLISNLGKCFGKNSFKDIVCKILYVLSMETNSRAELAKPSIIKDLMIHLTENPKDLIPKEMGSLGVNLSRNKECGELMWESNKLSQLVKNARKKEDIIGMKIIRNLSEQFTGAFVLYESAGDIAGAIAGSTVQDFVTECIGTLAYFDPLKVDIETVTQKGRIFPWLKQTLGYYLDQLDKHPLETSVDLIRYSIDVILLIGNLCKSEDGARLIVGEGFADILMKIFLHEQADLQIVQKILFVFNKCTEHESISVFFALKTRVPNGLLEFLENATGNLKELCESSLENIGKYDDTWKENMQHHKFLQWNREWVETKALEEAEEKNGLELLEIDGVAYENIRNTNRHFLPQCGRLNRNAGRNSDENSEFSEDDDMNTQWSSENNCGNVQLSDDVFGLFRQQYEEEMAMQTKYKDENNNHDYFENDIDHDMFDYDSDPDSGWQRM